MSGGVYLYFPGVLSDGGTMLTRGSFQDLEKLGIRLEEGRRLTFYESDADDEDRPIYICAEGVLHFSEANKCWCALVDKTTFRNLPRKIDATD